MPKINNQFLIDNALLNDSPEWTWPQIGCSPINEFTTEGYIARAFPTLFPTGIADLRSPRPTKKVKPNAYFKFLM